MNGVARATKGVKIVSFRSRIALFNAVVTHMLCSVLTLTWSPSVSLYNPLVKLYLSLSYLTLQFETLPETLKRHTTRLFMRMMALKKGVA